MFKFFDSKDWLLFEDVVLFICEGSLILIFLNGFDVFLEVVNVVKFWLDRV